MAFARSVWQHVWQYLHEVCCSRTLLRSHAVVPLTFLCPYTPRDLLSFQFYVGDPQPWVRATRRLKQRTRCGTDHAVTYSHIRIFALASTWVGVFLYGGST